MTYLRRTGSRKKKAKRKQKSIYKSELERTLHEGPLKSCDYEPVTSKVLYTVEHYYNPDFVHPKHPKILYEAKGRFRDYREAEKYIAVRRCNPDVTLIFVFSHPHQKAYPQCKPRQDGSTLSLAEWATKHGFAWCTPTTIDQRLLK